MESLRARAVSRWRRRVPEGDGVAAVEGAGASDADALDVARCMALDGLAAAFEEAEAGRDWFALRGALSRVEDAVQSVWYASRVRDDGRR